MNAIERTVGEIVKSLRTTRGLSLRDLADRSGVSAAMLSQIERGEKSPTIGVLSGVARGLGVPLARLVEEPTPASAVRHLRAGENRTVSDPSGAVREHLGPAREGAPEFVRLVVPPLAQVTFSAHGDRSRERIRVETGAVTATIGEERLHLASGETVDFEADRPHAFLNEGGEDAVLYVVVEEGA